MTYISGPRRPTVSNLPPRVKERMDREPLLIQAQINYKGSRAGKISNILFRERAGLIQESARQADRSLDEDIKLFARGLEQREQQQPGSLLTKQVIEFGCGPGRVATLLAETGFILYTGIELAEPLLRQVKNEAGASGLQRNNFQAGDLLTFKTDRKFNAAVALDLSTLSPSDQGKALVNLDRLLAAKGQLLLRWVAGENDVRVLTETTPEGVVEGWVFRASQGYIQRLVHAAGLCCSPKIKTGTVLINAGTPAERAEAYYLVSAWK
jgi:SAM-dependent methyltransferase